MSPTWGSSGRAQMGASGAGGGGGGPSLPLTIESFERASPLDAYRGVGANSSITTTGSEVFDGSKALTFTDSEDIFYDDTDKVIEADATYDFRTKMADQTWTTIWFFCNATSTDDSDIDGYSIEVDNHSTAETIRVREWTNGVDTTLDSVGTTEFIPDEEWLRCEFSVDTGTSPQTIAVNLYNASDTQIETVSVQDDTYTSGDWGWGAAFVGSRHIDFLQKTADTPL